MLSVDLSNNVIVGELPSASFASNTQLNTIVLSNNQISGVVVDGTFANNTKLVSLNFANNDVTTVESNAFSSNLLEVLDLSGNELESINGGLDFSSVITNKWITLRALNISNNKITRLEANAFAGLTNIEQIFIQKNRVETIEVTSFSGCTKLTEIDLGGNQLETLKIGTFENLPALKSITLVGNVVVADTLIVGALGKDKLLIDGKVRTSCAVRNVANSDKASGVADLEGVEGDQFLVACLHHFHIDGSTTETSGTATCGANGKFNVIVCVADDDANDGAGGPGGDGATPTASTNVSSISDTPSSTDYFLSKKMLEMLILLSCMCAIGCCGLLAWCCCGKNKNTKEQVTKIIPITPVTPFVVIAAKRDDLVNIVRNYVGTFKNASTQVSKGLNLDNVKQMLEQSVNYMTIQVEDEFIMVVSQDGVEKLAACWNQFNKAYASVESISLFLVAEFEATQTSSKAYSNNHKLARLVVMTAVKKYKKEETGAEERREKRLSRRSSRRKQEINTSTVNQIIM